MSQSKSGIEGKGGGAAVYEGVLDRRGSRWGITTAHRAFLCKISPSVEAVPLSGWVRGRVGEATEGRGRGSAVVKRVSDGWL